MQAAIDRVMQTYVMMVNLTPKQQSDVRAKVSRFLEDKGDDEHRLAVEVPQAPVRSCHEAPSRGFS
jgi:hypothetical protein